jgi:hypothetical protein
MKRAFEITGLLAVLSIAAAASGQAADPAADDERLAQRNAVGKGAIHHNAHPDGILPLIDYSGDLWSRSTLTGNWGGVRESLAAKGISTDLSFATVLQGVAYGGANTAAKVGTSMDLGLHLDFMRMGLIPGGLLSLRAEGDFGDSVLEDAGTITAVNYVALLPVGTLDNDTATISDLYYTQFLGKQFGVFAGRFDTMHDGMVMEFAGGGPRAGERGFLNTNFAGPR